MNHLLEKIFGLQPGFLSSEGSKTLSFNPVWPGHHAAVWNVCLAILALVLVVYVYRRDGRSRPARVFLGCIRALLVALVLFLLNRPVLVNVDTRREPSVLAVLLDDTASMKIPDVSNDNQVTRLDAARNLLLASSDEELQKLERIHTLRFYKFDSNATPIGPTQADRFKDQEKPAADQFNNQVAAALRALKPEAQSTQVVSSLLSVMDDLQGQRLAGVVVMTDGRETPRPADEAMISTLKEHHVKVYPVAVGGEKSPPNVYLTSIAPLDVAFKDDIVSVKVTLGATGFPKGHPVRLSLIDKQTKLPLVGVDDRPASTTVELSGDHTPVNAEILFKPKDLGILNFQVVAEKQPGELDFSDNILPASLEVVDSSINVLYVEGYPRWEYRYIKNGMIRDTTVNISCLLTSADVGFIQEGDPAIPPDGPDRGKKFPGPITRFPESIEELMPYDVVLFGDVDPRQFTDRQLQLVADFVAKHGGGFGMIAGQHWAPLAYRNTPLEAILPVDIKHVTVDDPGQTITEGFRPVLTPAGAASTIFRFYADEKQNERFLKEDLQPIFWYCRGLIRKSVAQVYAEHPFDIGPDGQKAPILVMGQYGSGRTLFSAIDDSWRWRYYTGESVFNTYWVQQLRYLARGKKIGSRDHEILLDRTAYDLGDQIRVTYRVHNPTFLQQLPPEIPVQMRREDGTVVSEQKLQRREGQPDMYEGSFTADHAGQFALHISSAPGELEQRVTVVSPQLEMEDVSINRPLLNRLAEETRGQMLTVADAPAQLAAIPSLERQTPNPTTNPLWNGWAPLILFVLLITGEWVLRKVYGML